MTTRRNQRGSGNAVRMETLESRKYMITGPDGLDPGWLESLYDDTPPFPALEAPRSLGAFSGQHVRKVIDSVASDDLVDVYKIKVTEKMRLYLDLRGMSQDADLVLYDGNGNAVAISGNYGPVNERIAKTVRKGTYFAAVFHYDGDTNYTFRAETRPAPVAQS